RGFNVHTRLGGRGFGYLRQKMEAFNSIASYMPVIVLTDLDTSRTVYDLRKKWLPKNKSENLIFRIAVREIESWILADSESFSEFLGVSKAVIPRAPDELANPKDKLLELVKKSSKRSLKEEMLPAKNSSSPIGLGYNVNLCSYVEGDWSFERACERSPSLARAKKCLSGFVFK
ncbi:DUF4276 family protein, partial [Pseudomonas aeruginosa]|nr:DUF4276 family protein [Pseudomonas aeruginosa]